MVVGILGIAVLLGLSFAAPSTPPGAESAFLTQGIWRDPVPSFLSSARGVDEAAATGRSLIPIEPPRALSVSAPASRDSQAAAVRGGIPIQVFFSRRPDSDSAVASVFPVTRVAADRAVATAALTSLVKGPSAGERADGYFSELGSALTGPSSCSGQDFRIAIADGRATVRFCRALTQSGVGQSARIRSQIEATLRQFPTIRSVSLLGSTGRCLFDQSGKDTCLTSPVAAEARPVSQAPQR